MAENKKSKHGRKLKFTSDEIHAQVDRKSDDNAGVDAANRGTQAAEYAADFTSNTASRIHQKKVIKRDYVAAKAGQTAGNAAASRDAAVPSMVFDEIDTGIGGRTAQMVAERIALVARFKQVLCITHLPQIACMADVHLYISKSTAAGATITQVRQLTERERISEVARMASGVDVTAASLDNAKEMVSHAMVVKNNFS